MSKYIRLGEVFTTDEGVMVQCVEAEGFCKDCVFLNTESNSKVRCKCLYMDIDCSEYSREDGRDVVFKEIGRITANKEYKPGTVLKYRDKLIICKECKPEDHCGDDCVFWEEKNCLPIPCYWRDRSDRKAVQFIEIKDFDPSKEYKPGDIVNVSGRLLQAEMKVTFVEYANEE